MHKDKRSNSSRLILQEDDSRKSNCLFLVKIEGSGEQEAKSHTRLQVVREHLPSIRMDPGCGSLPLHVDLQYEVARKFVRVACAQKTKTRTDIRPEANLRFDQKHIGAETAM